MEKQELRMWIVIVILIGVAFGGGYLLSDALTEEGEEEGKIKIIDDLGRTVTLSDSAGRIVSLSPSVTETLYAIGAEDKLVGRDRYSTYPPEVENDLPEDVGGGMNPNIEMIIGLEPDVIMGWYWSETALSSIEDKIPCIYFDPTSFNGILDNILVIGLVADKLSEAEALVADMQSRADAVTAITDELNSTQRPRVYIEVGTDLMTVGGPNSVNELIFMAGGVNIAGDEPLRNPLLSSEYIINKNPEVILLIEEMGGSHITSIEEVKARDGWGSIDAVQKDRIYAVEIDWISPNPRTVLGIEYFAYWFHPSLFSEPTSLVSGLTSILYGISVN